MTTRMMTMTRIINNADDDFNERRQNPQCGCGEEACKRIINQKADVSVPIEITPDAIVGRIQFECLGNPQIDNDQCGDSCRIVVTQRISVRIPIQFNVATDVGESEVVCLGAN